MFEFNPDLVQGDDDEADAIEIERESDEEGEEENVQVHDITNLAYVPTEADNSGTQATADRLAELASNMPMVNGADIDGKVLPFILNL